MIERPKGILVVEDESIVAHDLQQTLTDLGYGPVALAASTEEAIARASERCPDLVLMDIRIKGQLDGISTARLLKERFAVPIVYLTAHADAATIERAKMTEPHGYLLKPVKADELRGAVEIALYKHAMDKRLRERERWFSTTLRSISDAVITVDLAGRVTFMNPAAEGLTGCPAGEALGRPAREFVRLVDDNLAVVGEIPLERALREGRAVVLAEAALQRVPDGEVRIVADSATPVVDKDETLGAVMVFRDITEQRKLQAQIELAHRLASLGTMAAGVAHEINNPLGVIVGGAEIVATELRRQRAEARSLSDGSDAERTQRLDKASHVLELLQSAASRIGTIVSQLQTFSPPRDQTSGQADVDRAVEWAIWTTSREFRSRARVVTRLQPVPPVKLDESRLGQVLVNLLVNAAQAITPGDVEHNEVSVSTHTDDRGRVVVEVRDTGSGVPPEMLDKVFDPFFTTKPVGGGQGLGLSICHGIVASVGGELTLESRVGAGSVFRVALPQAVAEPRGQSPGAATPRALPRARILVIDDEEMMRKILAESLGEHEVTCVSRAKEVLTLLEQGERFDVILCDLMMPEMTGIDLYEALLASRPDAARRMVFMTGGATTARSADFLRTVPNPSLAKPFGLQTLQAVLEPLLTGSS